MTPLTARQKLRLAALGALLGDPESTRYVVREIRAELDRRSAIRAWEDDGGAVAPER